MSAVEELKLRRLLSMSNGSEVKNLHISSDGRGKTDDSAPKSFSGWNDPQRLFRLFKDLTGEDLTIQTGDEKND